MQKDLKIMDKELANNQLIRIHDQNTKQDQSIFRALSAAVYYSHLYAAQVKLDLRLGLVCNLNERKNNPYPPLGEGNILKKFINEGELVMNFWERQELECFHHVRFVIGRTIWCWLRLSLACMCVYTPLIRRNTSTKHTLLDVKTPTSRKSIWLKLAKDFTVFLTLLCTLISNLSRSISLKR